MMTLETLDRWIDNIEPKPQTTKYVIPDYPFLGLIVRPNGVKSIYIKNGNKKMCDVGFLFKGDGFAKVWNDFVNSKDYIRYEDTIKTLIEKHGLPKSGNPEIACNIKDEEHYASVFFDFTLARYSTLDDLFRKAKKQYIDDKIKTYRNFVNISVRGGGFILFLFLACVIIDNIEHLSTFSFISYLVLVFIGSFLLTGILDERASSAILNKHFEEAKTLSIKNDVEYRNAMKDELKRVNKIDRSFQRRELLRVTFLEAKELLPDEFTKEVKSYSQASEVYWEVDVSLKKLILSKTDHVIDQIVERQIDEFIALQVRFEEIKERVEKNMNNFSSIAKAE